MDYEKILDDIRKKIFYPFYFLTGEEAYFIDQLSDALENNVLETHERDFNQSVVYGRDVSISSIIDMATRYPMFASHQLIIVKEAQDIKENIEEFTSYIENPIPTTILVLCYKYKKVDKRKKFGLLLQAKAVFYETKKMYDNHVSDWLVQFVKSKGYGIDPKVAIVMVDHIGTDLSRMVQEVQKLMLNIPPGSVISIDHIEKYIGISKDFNVFELQQAIGSRNIFKANQIAFYMATNPRENPIQKIAPILYAFFVKLLLYHSLPDKSSSAVTTALKIHPFFVSDYQRSAKHYPREKVESIISVLRDYDLRSKGVNNSSTESEELIREMLYKIMH